MKLNLVTTYSTDDNGFTLIETLIAMVILVIGIFSLYSMQTTSVQYNATASGITTSSTWAADRIEKLLALDYDDDKLSDDNDSTDLAPKAGNGHAGLSDTSSTADGKDISPDGTYTIYWNIADYLTPNPTALTESTIKAIRVVVQRNDFGNIKEVTLNYYKQKVF